jgi:hypothetical protein
MERKDMHPSMQDWLDELTNGYLRDRKDEAKRFLDVVNRGGGGSWSAADFHRKWKARPGFEVVKALAVKLVRGEVS